MKTNRVRAGLLVSLCLFGAATASFATDYYVKNGGNDTKNGKSDANAWASIARVNQFLAQNGGAAPGDRILFKRGSTWRDFVKVERSGTNASRIVLKDYGSGNLPLLLGAQNISASNLWTPTGTPNVWQCQTNQNTDVGELYFNNNNTLGIKRLTVGELNSALEFSSNASNGKVYLYSTSNPGTAYSNIQAAFTRDIVGIKSGINFITVENLEFKYGGANGVYAEVCQGITIDKCKFSWIGGGYLVLPGLTQRFGNGVTIYSGSLNCVIKNSQFYDIFDSGMTYQNINRFTDSRINIENAYLYNCLFYNCGLASIELTNEPGFMKNVRVINNTSVRAGYGWGAKDGVHREPGPAALDPDEKLGGAKIGAHISFTGYQKKDPQSNVVVRNNILYNCKDMMIFTLANQGGAKEDFKDFTAFDTNLYYDENANRNILLYFEYTFSACPSAPNNQFSYVDAVNQFCLLNYEWNEDFYYNPAKYRGWNVNTSISQGYDLGAIQAFAPASTFASYAGLDFRVGAYSEARDSGVNSAIGEIGSVDIRGETRPYNATIDIGAYEYAGPSVGRLAAEENPEENFEIYPNPITSGELRVPVVAFSPEAAAEAQVRLTDMMGKTVARQKGLGGTVNVSKLPTGAYVLSVDANGKLYRKKVLVVND